MSDRCACATRACQLVCYSCMPARVLLVHASSCVTRACQLVCYSCMPARVLLVHASSCVTRACHRCTCFTRAGTCVARVTRACQLPYSAHSLPQLPSSRSRELSISLQENIPSSRSRELSISLQENIPSSRSSPHSPSISSQDMPPYSARCAYVLNPLMRCLPEP